MIRLRSWALAAVAVSALMAPQLTAPGAALADGDPASDVLLTLNVFNPYDPPISAPVLKVLESTIARAHATGFAIKVAIIEGRIDLGAIPQLYGEPASYAKFLDAEISYNSVAKLLVVMPQGFGTFAAGPPGLLAGIRINRAQKSDGLAIAATKAVVVLARHAGHPLTMPALPGDAPAAGSSFPAGAVAAVVVMAAVAAAGLLAMRRRRVRARAAGV